MDKKKCLISLLSDMISHPSTDGNEASMSDFLADTLKRIGMDEVVQQEVLPNRKNVIARKRFGSGGKTILLNSHMDIVPPADGWETDPYQLIQRGSRVYGRGVCDAKGPLACLTMAVQDVIRNPGNICGEIVYTAVVDEEAGSAGARALVGHEWVKGDCCIVGEPTLCRVAIGHNGSLRPVIAVEGVTAHASNPELGVNAIRVAAYISSLVDEIAKDISALIHPTTGRPSVSITMIKGGVQENVIPDYCELVIDRRMVPGESETEIISCFETMCNKAQEAFPGGKVRIDRFLTTTGPASETHPDNPFVRLAYAAVESVTGEKQQPFGLTCNTDMNHFVRAGIPTVVVGPGSITAAHKPNEWVEIDQLEVACVVNEAIIRAVLGGKLS